MATEQLSPHFTLAQLTVTDQKVPNIPNAAEKANLKDKLCPALEMLWSKVGPFKVISAFRSQAVNASLQSGGDGAASATQASSTSYHMLGLAADIVPTTMTAEKFMAEILKNPDLKNKLGEIALKNTALHVSAPTATKVGVAMYVNSAGKYIKLTAQEITAILDRYKVPVAISAVGIVAVGLAAIFYLRSRRVFA